MKTKRRKKGKGERGEDKLRRVGKGDILLFLGEEGDVLLLSAASAPSCSIQRTERGQIFPWKLGHRLC